MTTYQSLQLLRDTEMNQSLTSQKGQDCRPTDHDNGKVLCATHDCWFVPFEVGQGSYCPVMLDLETSQDEQPSGSDHTDNFPQWL